MYSSLFGIHPSVARLSALFLFVAKSSHKKEEIPWKTLPPVGTPSSLQPHNYILGHWWWTVRLFLPSTLIKRLTSPHTDCKYVDCTPRSEITDTYRPRFSILKSESITSSRLRHSTAVFQWQVTCQTSYEHDDCELLEVHPPPARRGIKVKSLLPRPTA